jgi:hypothetical protein
LSKTKIVVAAGLGLCEHCGALVSIENMPMDSLDAVWACPKCKKTLTGKSFGYKKINEKCERTKWVGPDGKWVMEEPKEDFDLGNLHIVREAPRPIY